MHLLRKASKTRQLLHHTIRDALIMVQELFKGRKKTKRVEKKGVVKMKSKTAEPLYRQTIPIEDRGKTYISKYFRVDALMSNHLGQSLHPVLVECNLRIDFAPDGSIYKVEWINKKLDPK